MSSISNLYTLILFNYSNFSNRDLYLMLYELDMLSYAFYLKKLTKDNRSIEELREIIREEYFNER